MPCRSHPTQVNGRTLQPSHLTGVTNPEGAQGYA